MQGGAYESAQEHSENYLSFQFQSQSASATPPQENKESLPLPAAQNASEMLFLWQPLSPKIEMPCPWCSL